MEEHKAGGQSNPSGRVPIGISAYILGHAVRFDGGHKQDRFVLNHFAQFVDFEKVCPEVEMGLSVPRPTLRLIAATEPEHTEPYLFMPKTQTNYPEQMEAAARQRVAIVDEKGLCGFVVQKKNSCGMKRIPVYGL